MREQFPTLMSAQEKLIDNPTCMEGALVTFWRVYCGLEQVEPVRYLLDSLLSDLKSKLEPDAMLSVEDAVVFAHLAAAKAVWLEKKGLEEFISVVEDGCRAFKRAFPSEDRGLTCDKDKCDR